MLPDIAIPALVASLGLLALIGALLVLTRLLRSHRERHARARRDHYVRVLRGGSPEQVAAIARRARRSRAARADLIRCVVSELPALDGVRAALLREASARGGSIAGHAGRVAPEAP